MATNVAVMQASMSLNPTGRKFIQCCKGPKSDAGVTRFPTLSIDAAALVGLALAIGAIVTSELLLADITGGLLLCFCPYMAYQKRALIKLGGFRDELNEMRQNVNEFVRQNNALTLNVNKLGSSVTQLEHVESDLAKLANTDNIDRLKEVVGETKRINGEMKRILESSIIQQMITTVIRTDRDGDLKIGPIELKKLMSRLHAKPGFDFNEARFLALLGNTDEPVKIESIMKVIRNLKDDTVAEGECVFVMRPEQLLHTQ